METRSNHVLVGSVVLILLIVLALFTVWLARFSGNDEKEFDIFFEEAVEGLNKGSPVGFSGVNSGQVTDIALVEGDPERVRVRIAVNPKTPVLKGTTATIQGVGFTGVSQVQLSIDLEKGPDGRTVVPPPLTCPEQQPARRIACPFGVPTIPPKRGGLGAILSSAPQLLERLSKLTERLTAMLSDDNQASISGILKNTNRLTKALADRGPEIAATLAETRVAIQRAGVAAQQIGNLAQTTEGVLANDVGPAVNNLNRAISSAQRSAQTLEQAINEARPGLRQFSTQTIPEAGQLIQDLREMSAALTSVAEKLDRGGAGSLISPQRLPDYEPKGKR